ncbi:MAG: BMP family protein [Desulfobacterales bacterium]|nr:BMP family protein [Desulfobacterales bacterium]
MKIYNCTFFLIYFLISIIACDKADNRSNEINLGAFKVAVILPGPKNDNSWSHAGYEAILSVQKELGTEVAYSENIKEKDFDKTIIYYAEKDFDFIISHGNQFISSLEKIAQQFPQTKFAVVGNYEGNNKNLGSLSFKNEEIAYLCGVIAAVKTKKNRISFIGGIEYENMKELASGFSKGALNINQGIKVSISYIGSWDDKEKAKNIANKEIDAGSDVLAVDADSAGLIIHDIAQKKGIFTIGWVNDQYNIAPGSIVTSAIQRLNVIFLEGVNIAIQGRWEGKSYRFGILEGALDIAPFRGSLSTEQEQQIINIKNEIIIGNRLIDTEK